MKYNEKLNINELIDDRISYLKQNGKNDLILENVNEIKSKIKINNNKISIRDKKVVYDQLYPPLNRDPIYNNTQYNENELVSNLLFYNNTRNSGYDTYHLVANLTRDSDNFQLLLFGRLKCRGCTSEFYASPADINLASIKIPIDKVNDIYNIPSIIKINDIYPGTYKVIELKYPDYPTNYY